MRTESIKVSQIVVGDRFRKEYKNLKDFAESIKKFGLIHNIVVREADEGMYNLLAGGRRLKTITEELGWESVTANIYGKDEEINEVKGREIELEENLQRENLTWPEECQLKAEIVRLKQEIYGKKSRGPSSGISTADVAVMLGESRQNMSLDLQLADALNLIPDLANAKNKAEARRMLLTIGKQLVREDAAKEIDSMIAVTGIDIMKKQLAESYIVGDAFENMKTLPDRCIDFLDVDTPYGIDLKGVKKLDNRVANINLTEYNEIDATEFPEFLDKLFKECFRILKDDGWMLVWFGPEPWFETVYTAIVNAGFLCKRIPIIWNKLGQPGQTNSPSIYLANNYEFAFYARKSDLSKIQKSGRSNVFSYKKVDLSEKVHPTTKPIELMMELIEVFMIPSPSKIVLVPFAGSGNTILAASNLGVSASGTDLNSSYRDAFLYNIMNQEFRKYKSYKE